MCVCCSRFLAQRRFTVSSLCLEGMLCIPDGQFYTWVNLIYTLAVIETKERRINNNAELGIASKGLEMGVKWAQIAARKMCLFCRFRRELRRSPYLHISKQWKRAPECWGGGSKILWSAKKYFIVKVVSESRVFLEDWCVCMKGRGDISFLNLWFINTSFSRHKSAAMNDGWKRPNSFQQTHSSNYW